MMLRSTSAQRRLHDEDVGAADVLVDLERDSVSGNRCSRACPIETPRNSAISCASAGCALPENSFSWPPFIRRIVSSRTETPESTIKVVGAGGFEPPNTGSKVPRLTAWPRPIDGSGAARHGGYRRSTRCEQPQGAARQACPQKVKSTVLTRRLAIGTGPPLVFGAGERPGQQRPRAAPRQRLDRRAAAAARLRNRPKTAEPLPDIAAASAPASFSAAFSAPISGWRRTTGRLEVVDHLRGPAWATAPAASAARASP